MTMPFLNHTNLISTFIAPQKNCTISQELHCRILFSSNILDYSWSPCFKPIMKHEWWQECEYLLVESNSSLSSWNPSSSSMNFFTSDALNALGSLTTGARDIPSLSRQLVTPFVYQDKYTYIMWVLCIKSCTGVIIKWVDILNHIYHSLINAKKAYHAMTHACYVFFQDSQKP